MITIHKLKRHFFFLLANTPMPGYRRQWFYKHAGIKFQIPANEKSAVFLGKNITFDTIHPELIEIGNYTTITTGCIILTHFVNTRKADPWIPFYTGEVKIGRYCFIGANAIICKPITIGDHSIIAAGSVVTCDIPPKEIWGGNPARYIKNREEWNK